MPLFSTRLASSGRRAVGAVMLAGALAAPLALAAAAAESWLGLQVTYADRGYAFTPWPAIELRKVTIRTAQEINIGRAWVTPDWAEWLTSLRTNRIKVRTDEVTATPAALARLGTIDGKSSHKVSTLAFDRLKLRLGDGTLDLPAGEMDFAPDGTLAHVRIRMGDKLTFEAAPAGDKLNVLVQAGQLKWAGLPVFLFDSVAAQGVLDDQQLVLDRIGANGDGGAVSGRLRLTLTDRYVMDGELKLASLRARDFLSRTYPRTTVQGDLNALVKFAGAGTTFEELGASLTSSGTFVIKAGAIDRLGLLEGMRKASAGPAGGGLTRFETLEGGFSAPAGKPVSVSIRRMDAGAMHSSGAFVLTDDGQVRGNMSGTLRLPGGEVSTRGFSLTGKVDSPTLEVR